MVMGVISYEKLEEEIEFTRQNMIFVGLEYGLTHPATIFLSAKLDRLMNHLSEYEIYSIHDGDIQKSIIHA